MPTVSLLPCPALPCRWPGGHLRLPSAVRNTNAGGRPGALSAAPPLLRKRLITHDESLQISCLQEAGHNYRVDHDRTGLTAGSNRKKGGHLDSTLKLLRLCLDRAADSGGVGWGGVGVWVALCKVQG